LNFETLHRINAIEALLKDHEAKLSEITEQLKALQARKTLTLKKDGNGELRQPTRRD
jgi:hypothetical protein